MSRTVAEMIASISFAFSALQALLNICLIACCNPAFAESFVRVKKSEDTLYSEPYV